MKRFQYYTVGNMCVTPQCFYHYPYIIGSTACQSCKYHKKQDWNYGIVECTQDEDMPIDSVVNLDEIPTLKDEDLPELYNPLTKKEFYGQERQKYIEEQYEHNTTTKD
ncbi:MAG: hypothetical protein J6X18_09605 [Bacteroidales bacterium]|nr:hypothetical protein [Bacteroidales bacterium]